MRWKNHKIVTLSAVYSLTGGLAAALAAMVGSVLPDVLEFRQQKIHRTITHSLWGWLALCLFLWVVYAGGGYISVRLYILFFVAVGAVLHICEDALSIGGVPLKSPFGESIGLKIYRTGTFGEVITAAGLIFVFSFFSWRRGFLESSYLERQLQELLFFVRGVLHV